MMPGRKLPPPETPEQEIERFSNMLRASMIDATATLARLVELSGSKRGRRELITSYILDELNDDLNTVASLAAVLYGLGLKHADIPKNPLKKTGGITMTTEKMVRRARNRMQEAQEARRVAVKAWVVETAVTASPAAEREAWRSVLQAHAAERSAMEAYRHAAAALKREHEREVKENGAE